MVVMIFLVGFDLCVLENLVCVGKFLTCFLFCLDKMKVGRKVLVDVSNVRGNLFRFEKFSGFRLV